MKSIKNLLFFLFTLLCVNLPIFAQTVCQNPRADSTPAPAEKYVYKTYLQKNDNKKELKIALVRPVDDLKNKKRPLIIGIHSGGFLDTCFFEPCYLKYSENILTRYFMPQGFLTASIQYRLTSPLGFKPPRISDEVLRETQYKAAQDAREAIKYIFENAEKLGVDTENVFLVGTSAGAITALHAAYLDNEETTKSLSEKFGSLAKKENIRGVISLSGAIYDLSFLKNEDTPLMIVHGKEDFIVPYEKGFYLNQKHLTPVFGGKAVFEEAGKLKIPVKGYFYDFGHSIPSSYKKEVFQKANDFIKSNLNCQNSDKPTEIKK